MPDAAAQLPLAGIKILDLTANIAGPFASMILGDLGATVIKVEPIDGDISRAWPPFADGTSTTFAALNRGKLSVAVDAKQLEGRALLTSLAARCDVFLESMRPGKAESLGLGWEDLGRVNPRLIHCSVNAFGDVGPMAGLAGFDAIIQAYSGIMDLTGYPDGDPCRVGTAVIDCGTGMWAAIAILATLCQPDPGLRGGPIQTTLFGTAFGFLIHHLAGARLAGAEPVRLGTAQHNFAPYEAIPARDRMVMVGVNSDDMWSRFCRALGLTDLADELRFQTNAGRIEHRRDLIAGIEAKTATLASDEVVERLTGVGVPASVVRPVTSLVTDPQVDALGLWGSTAEGHRLPRIPVEHSRSALGGIPQLGEHTDPVLREIGVTPDEIADLRQAGVIATAPRVNAVV